jgi:phospholipid/cholesterol/gamma-HCH transport system substrate-binding protein
MASTAAIRRRRVLALLGVALLIAIVVFVWLSSGGGGYRVNAVFDDVNGLVAGADVKAGGVDVGSVSSIELDSDSGLPKVTMEIDDGFRLERGATANLRSASAAGQVNRFISLTQGKGERLSDGATIGLASTDQPVEVDAILSSLDAKTRADVRRTLAGIDLSTRGRGADMAATMRNSARALGNTADAAAQGTSDREALRTLVGDGRQVVETLAADRRGLGATADELASTLGVTARRQSELAASVERLPDSLRAPRQALDHLDASIPDLRSLVASAKPGVRRLVPFSRALRPTLAHARPALRGAAGLVSSAPGDLRALRPVLDEAKPTLSVANPALRSAGPILDEARVRTPDFFSFFSNWADFTSVYDANGHAARVGVVLGTAPTNVIDGSDSGAGHLAAPFIRTPGVLEGEPWSDYRDSFIGSDFK